MTRLDYTASFQRIEKKYLLTGEQFAQLAAMLSEYMEPDEYGLSTICNLYLDTEDDLLVRRSLARPNYKEKMRLRSYGVPGDDDPAFLEIKKKAGGVVYKRRVELPYRQAMAYLRGECPLPKGQITSEIDYMVKRYRLQVKEYLAYDRVAYRELSQSVNGVRITVDKDIRSREADVDLRLGDAGKLLLPKELRLMEIKTTGAYPLWLSRALSQARAFPISFSKIGRVYEQRTRTAPPSARQTPERSCIHCLQPCLKP